MKVALIFVMIVFSVVRIMGYHEVHIGAIEIFQPFAHIYWGFLFGLWWATDRKSRTLFWLWVSFALVELICFLLGIGK